MMHSTLLYVIDSIPWIIAILIFILALVYSFNRFRDLANEIKKETARNKRAFDNIEAELKKEADMLYSRIAFIVGDLIKVEKKIYSREKNSKKKDIRDTKNIVHSKKTKNTKK